MIYNLKHYGLLLIYHLVQTLPQNINSLYRNRLSKRTLTQIEDYFQYPWGIIFQIPIYIKKYS